MVKGTWKGPDRTEAEIYEYNRLQWVENDSNSLSQKYKQIMDETICLVWLFGLMAYQPLWAI